MDAAEGVAAADAPGTDQLRLAVRGYACEVFDEPATAWTLHQETHLMAWRGEAAGPLVDRFDARNLLDERAQFRQLKRPAGKRKFARISEGHEGVDACGEQAALLHRLRYGDYAVEFPDEQADAARTKNRFPYRYPEDVAGSEEQEEDEEDGEAFAPAFCVPDGVQAPRTLRRHAIIQATADKVRRNPQLEVMMKVRLGDNAAFAFLRPASLLHAYYCFLRDENPREGANGVKSPGFLLLGGDYEDSDEENGDPPSSQAKAIDASSCKR